MVNLECGLTEHPTPIAKIGPALKVPKGNAATLRTLGVNICGLANNPFFDFGRIGAADTLSTLAEEAPLFRGFESENEK